MVLSVQNILQYIYKSSLELVSFNELFDDEVKVIPSSSINNTFIVKFNRKKISLVIKQAFVIDTERKKNIKNEYFFTNYYLKRYKREELEIYPFDYNKLIMIREFIKDTNSISHFFELNFNKEHQLGIFLMNLAKEFRDIHFKTIIKSQLGLKLKNTFPFPDPNTFTDSQIDDKFWKEIKKSNLLLAFIEQQHKEWGKNKYVKNLIHQDANLANIIYRKPHTFFLIDWELCQNGDPLWDIAYFLLDVELILTKLKSQYIPKVLFDKYFFVEYKSISESDKLKLEKYQHLIKLKKLYFEMMKDSSSEWKLKQKEEIIAFEKLKV